MIAPTARIPKCSDNNPSLQCSVCGKWMRLYGKTLLGRVFERFYGSYETTDGRTVAHDGNVCVLCEALLPNAKPYDHPMLNGDAEK